MSDIEKINVNGTDYDILGEKMAHKAEIDGYYESMTAGNAEQLVGTVFAEDHEPYIFRTAGGALDIGDRLEEEIVGGTVAFNQICKNGNFVDNSEWNSQGGFSFAVSGNIATLTASSLTSMWNGLQNTALDTLIVGHKLIAMADVNAKYAGAGLGITGSTPAGGSTSVFQGVANTWTRIANIYSMVGGETMRLQVYAGPNYSSYASSDTIKIKNVILVDLTQMFGSTIADYIYSLEQATEGAGVAWLKSYGFFTKPYYEYNAGSLQSVKTSKHVTVGFNQWDEEWEVGAWNTSTGEPSEDARVRNKNMIPVLPNTTYYGINIAWLLEYDKNGEYLGIYKQALNATFTTSANTYYINFYAGSSYGTTYKHDICINLHWDGERDGEYEPYVKHEYPLPIGDLRGLFKLDSNNKLYCDGDIRYPEGKTNRRYGIVDLGTLNWYYDGTGGYFYSSDLGSTANTGNDNINSLGLSNQQNYSGNKLYIGWASTLYCFYNSYTDAATFKAAMSGQYLLYKLATPTEEESTPFQSPQIVDDFGTEEYIDAGVEAETRDVAIPVGHNSKYQPNLRAKLEMAPDSPSTDGDYLMRRNNGENNYVPYVKELPSMPSEDGTYRLKLVISGSTKTLSWEAEE